MRQKLRIFWVHVQGAFVSVRAWFVFKRRKLAFWVARNSITPYDGLVVSKVMYLEATQRLAKLAEYINSSGHLNNKFHCKRVLSTATEQLSQTFVNSMQAFNRGATVEQVRDVYVRQRFLSMSRRQREDVQRAMKAAAQKGASDVGKQSAV